MGLRVVVTPAGPIDMAKSVGTEFSGEPVFYGSGRDHCNVATIKVLDGDTVVKTSVVKLSGANLQLSITDRTRPSASLYEKKKKRKEEPKK